MSRDQEIIDFGMENYLMENDKDLSFVDVGVLARDGAEKRPPTDEGKQTDITLAELATIQEFGTVINVTPKMRKFLSSTGLNLKPSTTQIVIPSRAYMRQTFDEQLSVLEKTADKLDRDSIAGKISRREALQQLGQMHRQEIQKNIGTAGKFKANHPYTIARKGSDNELVDDGILRQSIDYEVG
jgi:hypothetical protein